MENKNFINPITRLTFSDVSSISKRTGEDFDTVFQILKEAIRHTPKRYLWVDEDNMVEVQK